MSEQHKRRPVRPKTFTYKTTTEWSYGKIADLDSIDKTPITVSSPPEFKGTPGLWTPEDLFVGAAEMCQMLTFLALAKKHGITVLAYNSSAEGTLEFLDGGYRFTRILVKPTIAVEEPATEDDVAAMVHEAHDQCLITNSISAEIDIQPEITIRSEAEALLQP